MSDYFDRVEQQLVRSVEARPARGRWRIPLPRIGRLAPVLAALIVVAVVGVFLSVRGRVRTAAVTRTTTVTFTATALDPRAPFGPALGRAVRILHDRLAARFPDVHVSAVGNSVIVSATGASRAEIAALAVPGKLAFYDWEATALTQDGRGVAQRLQAQDPNAVMISQGPPGAAPGGTGQAGLNIYDAVQLALGHAGHGAAAEYYMFGVPGSRACAIAARAGAFAPDTSEHCLLAGPAITPGQLVASLPPGVAPSAGRVEAVPRGIVVLQSIPADPNHPPSFASPVACFYVLRDHPALTESQITDPHVGRGADGGPDVAFGFTPSGARAFQRVTAAIARRGVVVSSLGETFNQHFAVALDNRLVTVPSVDFRSYPEGISGSGGADLIAGFTPASARDFAILLRYGPLPVSLQLH